MVRYRQWWWIIWCIIFTFDCIKTLFPHYLLGSRIYFVHFTTRWIATRNQIPKIAVFFNIPKLQIFLFITTKQNIINLAIYPFDLLYWFGANIGSSKSEIEKTRNFLGYYWMDKVSGLLRTASTCYVIFSGHCHHQYDFYYQ